jgi:YesN/AraC family two-component response regulator
MDLRNRQGVDYADSRWGYAHSQRGYAVKRQVENTPSATALQRQLFHAREARRYAREGVERAEDIAQAVADKARASGTARDVEAVQKADQLLSAARARLSAADLRVAKWESTLAAEVRWAERLKVVRRMLLRQYDGLGPQYELLVERAARAAVRAEQADEVAEETEAQEHRALSREIRETIQALQKHTESTKQEVIDKHVNAQCALIVAIVEQVVQPQAPELWREVTEVLSAKVPERN